MMKYAFFGAALAALIASPALANKGNAEEHFKMMDTNNDGNVSAAEHT